MRYALPDTLTGWLRAAVSRVKKGFGVVSEPDYETRVSQQIAQYSNMERLKGLPKIYRYWSQTYLVPKLVEVFGVKSTYDIYADAYIGASERSGGQHAVILSVGCGDGKVDVAVAEALLRKGFDNFTILATELSEIRLDRARKLVSEKEVGDHFQFEVVDVNNWKPTERFLGVMAQHALHHIVELETLFDFIHDHMEEEGAFVIVDMIGRNGHMRWPETLELVESFWRILPDKYKFQHQFEKQMIDYVNWDCSTKGFEGIRAQDILPLLVERFSFSHFLGVGGFVDIFVERGYGHNFDPDSETDRTYIDLMARLNDALLLSGEVKPTMIFAVARKLGKVTAPSLYRGLTPEGAVRVVD